MKKQSATPCYIDYLSKDHNFRQVRKEFTSLVEAMESNTYLQDTTM